MKRYLHLLATLLVFMAFSCSKEEPVPPTPEPEEPEKAELTLLIYTVANSNLYDNYLSDRAEILQAAPLLDLDKVNVLIYSYLEPYYQQAPMVEKLMRDADTGLYDFETVLEYPDDHLSTDPARISQVVNDVIAEYPANHQGLVLWGHATAWAPNFNRERETDAAEKGQFYSYGGENNSNWTDIDELALALPDNAYEFIWFDCCLMANIECVYQLRDKASFIVAYPLEIHAAGMPYDKTMPLICDLDLAGAADVLFNYYNNLDVPISTCIVDTSKLPALAEATRSLYQYFTPLESTSGIQKYSRAGLSPVDLYDFMQYSRKCAAVDADSDDYADYQARCKKFTEALEAAVVSKACSQKDFSRRPINVEEYSGLSAHSFGMANNEPVKEAYYKTLDWPQAVYSIDK